MNVTGHIKNVSHRDGATLVETNIGDWGAFTLGSIITAEEGTTTRGSSFMHEYGHYLQSRILGFTYLGVIEIPSIVSAGTNPNHERYWTEAWANSLSNEHFGEGYNYGDEYYQKLEGKRRQYGSKRNNPKYNYVEEDWEVMGHFALKYSIYRLPYSNFIKMKIGKKHNIFSNLFLER